MIWPPINTWMVTSWSRKHLGVWEFPSFLCVLVLPFFSTLSFLKVQIPTFCWNLEAFKFRLWSCVPHAALSCYPPKSSFSWSCKPSAQASGSAPGSCQMRNHCSSHGNPGSFAVWLSCCSVLTMSTPRPRPPLKHFRKLEWSEVVRVVDK